MMRRIRRGFTLLEILVVVAILGVILLFAIPALYRTLQSYYVKTAANQFAIHVRMARNLAVSQKIDYQIVINSDDASSKKNTYKIQNFQAGSYVDVPHMDTDISDNLKILSNSIYLSGVATLQFDSRGKIVSVTGTSPYQIDFQGKFLHYRVTVDPIGAVQIEEVG